jgi:hypothetical protein
MSLFKGFFAPWRAPYTGEVYIVWETWLLGTIYRTHGEWKKIRESDIIDKHDNSYKIKVDGKQYWFKRSEIIFYSEIYDEAKEIIENG